MHKILWNLLCSCPQFSDKGLSLHWVCFPKFHCPLAIWPWLRISPHSSLNVIYCLILTAWQWLMNFTCIPVQIESSKSPLRNRLLALLLWDISHLSCPSRSCLGRLILIPGGTPHRDPTLWRKRQSPRRVNNLSGAVQLLILVSGVKLTFAESQFYSNLP